MQKLYYQFPGTWFGDCMPFGHGDKFYLYHQRDTRKPGPFGEPFGWDLATTSDFVHYEDKGVAIPRGTDEEQDQCCHDRIQCGKNCNCTLATEECQSIRKFNRSILIVAVGTDQTG